MGTAPLPRARHPDIRTSMCWSGKHGKCPTLTPGMEHRLGQCGCPCHDGQMKAGKTEVHVAVGHAIGHGGREPVVVFDLLDGEMKGVGPVRMAPEAALSLAEALQRRVQSIRMDASPSGLGWMKGWRLRATAPSGRDAVLCEHCVGSAGQCVECQSHPEERDRAYKLMRQVLA